MRQGRHLDLRDDVESRMSHTAMQEVFIKTVHMLCKQQGRCALWNGLPHVMQQRPLTEKEGEERRRRGRVMRF